MNMIEMVVIKVSPYQRKDRLLLWLGEKAADHPRLLPIAIGEFEAAAIEMPLEGEEPIRPISYDLISSMLNQLKIEVRQVVIHAVHKSVYYAKIVIEKDRKINDIDSRPSDAVALALRLGAPIYVSRELLDQVGLAPLTEEEEIEHIMDRFYEFEAQISEMPSVPQPATAAEMAEEKPIIHPHEPEITFNPKPERDELSLLQSRLEQAVICEEYEEAARLRDEIESLVNKNKR
jgi:uncharacterized protein